MSINWGECIFKHYEKYMGFPSRRDVYKQDDGSSSIQIFEYDNFFKDAIVLASYGLSNYSEVLGERAEVYCPVDQLAEEASFIFANILFNMIKTKMQIGPGISIKGIANLNSDFVHKTGKSALYLSHPYGVPTGFSKISCESEICYMYTMVFISQNEHEYFVKHGSEALEDMFDEKLVDPIDILRPSCI